MPVTRYPKQAQKVKQPKLTPEAEMRKLISEQLKPNTLQQLIEQHCSSCRPVDAYRVIFHMEDGYVQKKGEEPGFYKSNPIMIYQKESRVRRKIMYEDELDSLLKEAADADWAFLGGCSYFGKANKQEHASKLHAMIFDIDGITVDTMTNFFFTCDCTNDIYPRPNFIALSGHGVHLYYVFDKPIDLFPEVKLQLKEMKYALTVKLWNQYTSTEKKIQYQGINQSFRIFGSKCKASSARKRCKVFSYRKEPWRVEDLAWYGTPKIEIKISERYDTKYPLKKAQELFPEWYEKVVVRGDKSQKAWKICEKVHGRDPFALYHWWKRKIESDATVGHRYFCLMCLAIYAAKCDLPFDILKKDAAELQKSFTQMSDKDPFTISDMESALECYDVRYKTFPIDDISRLTAIPIKKNKRNGRKQSQHLAGARAIQKINDEFNGTNWRDGCGRKAGSSRQREVVEAWQASHPDGKKCDCIRDTGLSRPTVYRWWKEGK